MTSQFIFAYGAIINGRFRDSVGHTGKATQVTVNSIRREWSIMVCEPGFCALGIVADSRGSCNGVIIEVSDEELDGFDRAELRHGYDRRLLDSLRIRSHEPLELGDGSV